MNPTNFHLRSALLTQAAYEAINSIAGNKPTEALHAEELAKVAAWMRRNGHWNAHEDVHVRDEQRYLAELERAALKRNERLQRLDTAPDQASAEASGS